MSSAKVDSYYQDDAGAWWYSPPGLPRRRYGAVVATCEKCGKQRPVSRQQVRRICEACNRYEQRPVGSRRVDRQGYVTVRIDRDDPLFAELCTEAKPWVLEHRYVMRQAMRRPFKRGEIVHHINGDRADNRLENLQLLARKEHRQGQDARCPRCGYHGMIFAGQNGGGLV